MDKEIIIFDFDGTLVDSLPLIYDCLSQVLLEEESIKISKDKFKDLKRSGVLEALKKLEIPFYKFPILYLKTRNRMAERVDEIKFYEGIQDLLSKLDEKELTIGIISNNKKSTIEKFLKSKNLECFDFIIGNSLFSKKTSRLRKTIKDKKEKAVYIGDQVGDIKAANETSISSIAVSWGFDSREELRKENPTFLVDNINNLQSLLLDL